MLPSPPPRPKQVGLLVELGIKGNQGQEQMLNIRFCAEVALWSCALHLASPARKHYLARVACREDLAGEPLWWWCGASARATPPPSLHPNFEK